MKRSDTSYNKFFYATLKRFKLTPLQGLMMHLIYGLSRQRGWAFPSKETLANKLNISKPTVYKCLKELEAKSLIERQRQEGRTTANIRPTAAWEEYYHSLQETYYESDLE